MFNLMSISRSKRYHLRLMLYVYQCIFLEINNEMYVLYDGLIKSKYLLHFVDY